MTAVAGLLIDRISAATSPTRTSHYRPWHADHVTSFPQEKEVGRRRWWAETLPQRQRQQNTPGKKMTVLLIPCEAYID